MNNRKKVFNERLLLYLKEDNKQMRRRLAKYQFGILVGVFVLSFIIIYFILKGIL